MCFCLRKPRSPLGFAQPSVCLLSSWTASARSVMPVARIEHWQDMPYGLQHDIASDRKQASAKSCSPSPKGTCDLSAGDGTKLSCACAPSQGQSTSRAILVPEMLLQAPRSRAVCFGFNGKERRKTNGGVKMRNDLKNRTGRERKRRHATPRSRQWKARIKIKKAHHLAWIPLCILVAQLDSVYL